MGFKVIVWNMAHKVGNWGFPSDEPELSGADVSLLCEASPPPVGLEAHGRWSTDGLEIALGPDKPVKRSSASATRHSAR